MEDGGREDGGRVDRELETGYIKCIIAIYERSIILTF
jgi:hypothetical protein